MELFPTMLRQKGSTKRTYTLLRAQPNVVGPSPHSRGHSTSLVGSSDCQKDRYIFNSCVGIYLVMTFHPWFSPDNKGHVASVFHLTGLQFDKFLS